MATHALIPRPWREALNAVAASSGTPQRELVSAAVAVVLARAAAGFVPDTPHMPKGSLVALVARIPEEQQAALHALAARTRIRYSEWLRQAVVDVLREHGAMPEAEATPAPPPAQAPQAGRRCGCGLRLFPGESIPCTDCREAA